MSKFSVKSDYIAMNVSWLPNELELFTNQASIVLSTIVTIILIITFLIGVIVQKTIFKMLKRLPERAINQMIYPYMVKTISIYICSWNLDFSNLSSFQTREKILWWNWFFVKFDQANSAATLAWDIQAWNRLNFQSFKIDFLN